VRQDNGLNSRSNSLLNERDIYTEYRSSGRDDVPDRSAVGAAESDRQPAHVVSFPLRGRESASI
jgi:hypothetical protein